jgi:hypothetical protein
MMTSDGKRKPAKADRGTGVDRGRRVLMPTLSLLQGDRSDRNSAAARSAAVSHPPRIQSRSRRSGCSRSDMPARLARPVISSVSRQELRSTDPDPWHEVQQDDSTKAGTSPGKAAPLCVKSWSSRGCRRRGGVGVADHGAINHVGKAALQSPESSWRSCSSRGCGVHAGVDPFLSSRYRSRID